MFERFTDSARAVVVGAQEEARGLGHNWIGCEHLLIAVAAEPEGQARSALLATGVTPDSLRSAVEEIVGRGRPGRDGPDAAALAAIGIDLDEVRRRAESAFGPGALDRPRSRRKCGPGGGAMPFTPRSKQVLERSLRNAVARGDKQIGSEHILLGILDVPETVAAEALGKLGVTPDRLRQQLGAT